MKMKQDDVGGGNQSEENSSISQYSKNGFIQLQGKQNMELTKKTKAYKTADVSFSYANY